MLYSLRYITIMKQFKVMTCNSETSHQFSLVTVKILERLVAESAYLERVAKKSFQVENNNN